MNPWVLAHVVRQQKYRAVGEFVAITARIQRERIMIPVIEETFIHGDHLAVDAVPER